MATKTVQVKGRAQVIKAYEMINVDTWAVWDGKVLNQKGEGADTLESYLQLLEIGATDAIYTLAVYEGVEPKNVKSNTPYDSAINFRLKADQMEVSNEAWAQGQISQRMKQEERLKAIEDNQRAIVELLTKQDEEEEDKPGSIGAVLTSLLNEPHKIGQLVEIGKQLLGLPSAQPVFQQPAPRPASVGSANPTEDQRGAEDETPEAQVARLNNALQIIRQHDPLFITHIEKLAHIANTNTPMFKFLLSTLEGMK